MIGVMKMKIGIVSDTHGYFDPLLTPLLDGVDLILHAGDVGSREVLNEFESIAPTHAVRGNVDPPELGLPMSRTVEIGGFPVEMLHILTSEQAVPENPGEAGAFTAKFKHIRRAVIFGHTHQPATFTEENTLFINPGSAGKKRFSLPRCFSLMQLSDTLCQVNTISLEGYNRIMYAIQFERE